MTIKKKGLFGPKEFQIKCDECGFERPQTVDTEAELVFKSRQFGWTRVNDGGTVKDFCPNCSK